MIKKEKVKLQTLVYVLHLNAGISLRKISDILAQFNVKMCHESVRQLILQPPYSADLLEYYKDAEKITHSHASKPKNNIQDQYVGQLSDLATLMYSLSFYIDSNDINYLKKAFINKKRNAFRDRITFDLNFLQFLVMGAAFYRCSRSSENPLHKTTGDNGCNGRSVADICRLRDKGGYTIDNCVFRLKSENISYARARERTTHADYNQEFIDQTDREIIEQIRMQVRVCKFHPIIQANNHSASNQRKSVNADKALFTHLYEDDVWIIIADNDAKGARSSALNDSEVFTRLFEEIYPSDHREVFLRNRTGMFIRLRKINGQYKSLGRVSNTQQKHFTKAIREKLE